MTLDPNTIAKRLGATYTAELSEVGAGAFGMARLAQTMKERLGHKSRRAGTSVAWMLNFKVSMTPETERALITLAATISTAEKQVDPTELAAQILEEAVLKLTKEQQE